ncbi:MAG: hypothetical protein ACO1OB_05905 [Archangium sp.]
MRSTTLMMLLVTLSCGCQRERNDPRVVEVTTPAHVTVRVIDVPEPLDCGAIGDWKAQLKCRITRAPRTGCTYVEVGSVADAPLRRTTPLARSSCTLPADRVKLIEMPVKRVRLEFDDAGTRGAVLFNDDAWVLYLHDGELVEARYRGAAPEADVSAAEARDDVPMLRVERPVTTDAGIDWSLVAPMLSVIPSNASRFTDAELDAEFQRTIDAQRFFNAGLANALETRRLTPSSDDWSRMAKRLDDAGRQEVRDTLLTMLEHGDEEALTWAEADEAIPRQALIDALETGLEELQYASPVLIEALFRLQPEVAAPLACKQLEDHELNQLYDGDDYSELTTALALIARYKVPCPWVVPMLMRVQCSAELRRMPTKTDDDTLGDLALATEQEKARALELIFTSPGDYTGDDEDFLADGNHTGWLLIAAAEAQGPLPDELLRRNARRTYRVINHFKGDVLDDPCRNSEQPPAEWACRMPPSLTRLTREHCALELDDAARTMTLAPAPGWVKPTQ